MATVLLVLWPATSVCDRLTRDLRVMRLLVLGLADLCLGLLFLVGIGNLGTAD